MSKLTEKDIPDLSGMVIIITGANSGVGFENVKQFTRKNATVIMACRNLPKGKKSQEKVKKKIPDAKVEVMKLDLANLKSIKAFTEDFKRKYDRLDVLLNNAGVMGISYQKTVDGFESQVGTNHLGHFALTAQLYDVLKKTKSSRIIHVSSTAHTMGQMDWDDFLSENKYTRLGAYGRSKLANLLFTYEMDRRFKAKDVDIKSVASHPGAALTGLADHIIGPIKFLIAPFFYLFLGQTAAKGALPSARAAVDANVKGGEYFGPVGRFGGDQRGPPKIVQSNAESHNLEDAKKLWEISEALTGINFTI